MAVRHIADIHIIDDFDALLNVLPPRIAGPTSQLEGREDLLEIVMDLERPPEARLPGREVVLSDREVNQEDIDYVVEHIGEFTDDNRAGIQRTLHRISAIRNRRGRIVGLTCRLGRAVFGTIRIIRDIVDSGKNILLLGRPGVGKTTMLREVARVLADEFQKRVIIVDTSNEIAGDGDIPHPAIGHARRMQVPAPALQHAVMIEAVENHMPEVIIIDEIGTELEAAAARTIAERGVQLIATAHGNTLDNLILNPTLCDLIGGFQAVTLGDEEARRRRTQKTILERKAPPTFDIVVEIQSWSQVAVHEDVASVVDAILRGKPIAPEVRQLNLDGTVSRSRGDVITLAGPEQRSTPPNLSEARSGGALERLRILPYGLSSDRVHQAVSNLQLPATITRDLRDAQVVLTVKSFYRKRPALLREAEEQGVPIYVVRNNSAVQIEQSLRDLYRLAPEEDPVAHALSEAQDAITRVLEAGEPIELSPQNAYIRRLQHQLAERYRLNSRSRGKDPFRRVEISPAQED